MAPLPYILCILLVVYLSVSVPVCLRVYISAYLRVCESTSLRVRVLCSLRLCTCMSTGLHVSDMCAYMPPCLCVSRRACVSCYSSFRVTVCPSVFCLHSRLTPPESLWASAAAASRSCGLFVCLSVCLRFYVFVCPGSCVFYGMFTSLRLRIYASVRSFLSLCTCTHVGICVGSCVCV